MLYIYIGASLVAQMVKNLPAVQETQVWSLGQEDPLEKGMATHCSILTWRIPWKGDPGGLHRTEQLTLPHYICILRAAPWHDPGSVIPLRRGLVETEARDAQMWSHTHRLLWYPLSTARPCLAFLVLMDFLQASLKGAFLLLGPEGLHLPKTS